MASVPIADVMIKIGIKADTRQINAVIKRIKQATAAAKEFRKVTRASFKLKGDARALGTLNKKITATEKKLKALQKAAAKTIKVKATGLGGGKGRAGAGGGGMGGGLGGARGFGGMVAGMSAFGLMASTVNTAQRLEGARASLIAATGAAETGAEAFAFLRSETQRIGVNLLDSSRAFTNLVASGRSVGFSMQQSQELFSATAEAARVLNLSTDDTAGALKAMQQMLSKGTVQSEELKGQLGERLPGAFGMAAQAMGVTTMELGKMLQRGEVLATELLPLLTVELRKFARTDGALAKAMQSNAAEMERMKNSFADMQDEVAKGGFLDAMTKLFKGLAGAMKAVTPAFIYLGKVIKVILSPIIAFLNILTHLNEMFGQTGVKVAFLATAFVLALTKIRQAVMLLTVAMMWNPLTYILGAIVAAILLIDDFLSGLAGKDSRFFQDLDKQIKQITDDLEPFIEALRAVLEFLGLIEDKEDTAKAKKFKEDHNFWQEWGKANQDGTVTPELRAEFDRRQQAMADQKVARREKIGEFASDALGGLGNLAREGLQAIAPQGSMLDLMTRPDQLDPSGEAIVEKGGTYIAIDTVTTTAETGEQLAIDLLNQAQASVASQPSGT